MDNIHTNGKRLVFIQKLPDKEEGASSFTVGDENGRNRAKGCLWAVAGGRGASAGREAPQTSSEAL